MATLTLKKKVKKEEIKPVEIEVIEQYPPIKEQLPEAQKKLAEYEVIKECKPLAIGIFNELAEGITSDKLSKNAVSKALRRHCMSREYLNSVINSKHRYGVNGEVLGDVTEEDREYSKKLLNELK